MRKIMLGLARFNVLLMLKQPLKRSLFNSNVYFTMTKMFKVFLFSFFAPKLCFRQLHLFRAKIKWWVIQFYWPMTYWKLESRRNNVERTSKMDGRFKEIKKSPMIILVMHEFHGTKGIWRWLFRVIMLPKNIHISQR